MTEKPKSKQLSIEGMVAVRDKQPYVVIRLNEQPVAQLDVASARSVAMDILQMCARTEADAMIAKFFGKVEFPDGALAALLVEFRDYRRDLDAQPVERSTSTPNGDVDGNIQ